VEGNNGMPILKLKNDYEKATVETLLAIFK